jgi:DNA-binding NarL/FixJ family response regulator
MRVVVAEDNLIAREGLVRLLAENAVDVVGQVSDAPALLELVAQQRPDAVVVDIRMPPTFTDEGMVVAQTLRAREPAIAVLLLSQYVEPAYAMRLLEEHQGHVGYLLKDRVSDIGVVIDALRRVVAGETVIEPEIVVQLLGRLRHNDPMERLTDRERQVLTLIAEGLSNRAIAGRLVVTERTVEAHVTSIFRKLDLAETTNQHRRVLAVLAFLRR